MLRTAICSKRSYPRLQVHSPSEELISKEETASLPSPLSLLIIIASFPRLLHNLHIFFQHIMRFFSWAKNNLDDSCFVRGKAYKKKLSISVQHSNSGVYFLFQVLNMLISKAKGLWRLMTVCGRKRL